MGKSQNVGIKSAFTPIKYIGGSGQVWQVQNFMTQTQPDPLLKKNFVTQPNPPSPKNQPNSADQVGSGRIWRVGGLATYPYLWESECMDTLIMIINIFFFLIIKKGGSCVWLLSIH